MTKQSGAGADMVGPHIPDTERGGAPRTPQATQTATSTSSSTSTAEDVAVDVSNATVSTSTTQARARVKACETSSSNSSSGSVDLSSRPCNQDDNESAFSIAVENLTGQVDTIMVRPTDTVAQLKQQIQALWNVSSNMQDLVCGGLVMGDDSSTLHNCNIGEGARVRMVVKVRSGPLDHHRSVAFTEQDVMAAVKTAINSLRASDPSVFKPGGRRGRHAMVVSLRSPDGDEIAQVHVQLKRMALDLATTMAGSAVPRPLTLSAASSTATATDTVVQAASGSTSQDKETSDTLKPATTLTPALDSTISPSTATIHGGESFALSWVVEVMSGSACSGGQASAMSGSGRISRRSIFKNVHVPLLAQGTPKSHHYHRRHSSSRGSVSSSGRCRVRQMRRRGSAPSREEIAHRCIEESKLRTRMQDILKRLECSQKERRGHSVSGDFISTENDIDEESEGNACKTDVDEASIASLSEVDSDTEKDMSRTSRKGLLFNALTDESNSTLSFNTSVDDHNDAGASASCPTNLIPCTTEARTSLKRRHKWDAKVERVDDNGCSTQITAVPVASQTFCNKIDVNGTLDQDPLSAQLCQKKKRKIMKPRCGNCNAKLGLVSFSCRCQLNVCGKCQHNHSCTYDYKRGK